MWKVFFYNSNHVSTGCLQRLYYRPLRVRLYYIDLNGVWPQLPSARENLCLAHISLARAYAGETAQSATRSG